MKSADLVTKLAQKQNLTHHVAYWTVKLIFSLLTEAMKKGERIEVRGFGSFAIRDYGNYTGRNPKTGEIIEVKPKRLPHFKVAKALMKRINGR